ncbi:MAG: hypothetical protein ABIO02_00830 [Patescibacteria group bacterium]
MGNPKENSGIDDIDPQWFGDEIPDHAYHSQLQAEAVKKAQREGRLIAMAQQFNGAREEEELGMKWYIFNDESGRDGMQLRALDVNNEVISTMNIGQILTVIQTRDVCPEAFDGRKLAAIGAVLKGDDALYLSKGFSIDLYRQQGLRPVQDERG